MDVQIEKGQSIATTRLYDAALLGDIQLLLDLLEEDPLILERCIIEKPGTIKQSPLHVAVAMGHLEFVVELLRREPKLEETIDQSKRSSPLHIASAKGHLKIIEALIVAKPNMCFAHDQDGSTPIFIAAVTGQIDALELLHRANPYATQGRTNDGESILHLCVKHNQLKALQRLLELVDDDGNQLINFRDNDGNTILHLAMIGKHFEMVEFLAGCQGLNKNSMNTNKMTVVDIHREQNRNNIKNWNVEQHLKRANARPAKEVLKRLADGTWLEEQRMSYMVVASLTATMAFQVGVNPPGDVWQDSKTDIKKETRDNFYHIAGTSIMSYYNSKEYNNLLISNTVGLISSLSVILLLISGFPCKRYFLVILRTTLWIAVTATSFTYYLAVYALIYEGNQGVWTSLSFYLIAWQGLMGSLLLGHVVRFILKLIGWQRRQALKIFCKRCFARMTNTNITDNTNLRNHV